MIFGLTAGAAAQDADGVRFAGGVYYKAICGKVAGLAARCQARIVTDKRRPAADVGGTADRRLCARRSARCLQDHHERQFVDDHRDRRCVRLRQCRSRSRRVSRAMGTAGLHDRQWLLQEAQPERQAEATIRRRTSAGRRNPRSISIWRARCARTARSGSSRPNNNSLREPRGSRRQGGKPRRACHQQFLWRPATARAPTCSKAPTPIRASRSPQARATAASASIYPASSPHVTAVGGTHLIHDGSARGWGETVWSGAGSGCSKHLRQAGLADRSRLQASHGGDVSAVADPATGVAVLWPERLPASATWLVFGGTSVSAPLIGGIYGNNGGTVNFGSNPYAHTDALFDVTSGSNGTCGAASTASRRTSAPAKSAMTARRVSARRTAPPRSATDRAEQS